MEPGERTIVDFGDSTTATKDSGILEVGTKFKSWTLTKEAIDAFQKNITASFTYKIVEL